MMAIGDGTQKIIADDIEKLGGPNQVQFWIRLYTYPRGKPKKRTTERYTLADVHAIEAECPAVLYVLPQNRRYPRWVTSNKGVQIRSTIEGVTALSAGQNLPNWTYFVQRTGKNMSKANRSVGSALSQKPYSL